MRLGTGSRPIQTMSTSTPSRTIERTLSDSEVTLRAVSGLVFRRLDLDTAYYTAMEEIKIKLLNNNTNILIPWLISSTQPGLKDMI